MKLKKVLELALNIMLYIDARKYMTLIEIVFSFISEQVIEVAIILLLTLGSNKNEWNFLHVSELRHLHVVVVDSVEASFIFQAEYKNNRIDPTCELKNNNINYISFVLFNVISF